MRIALFIPCYVDQLRPQVGIASLELLEARGHEVSFPRAQTCCGQPSWNGGDRAGATALARRFVAIFAGYDAVVAPSASCVATVRVHYAAMLGSSPEVTSLASRTWELCAFLAAEPGGRVGGRYPARAGLHESCHALRELRQGRASERRVPPGPDPARALLAAIDGLELVEVAREDECCGFGGAFAVEEEAVSRGMGEDRLRAHAAAGAELLISTDVSCQLHLEGLARRAGPALPTRHVAEVLRDAQRSGGAPA